MIALSKDQSIEVLMFQFVPGCQQLQRPRQFL